MYTSSIILYLYVCIWLPDNHTLVCMPINISRRVGVPRSSCAVPSLRRDLQAAWDTPQQEPMATTASHISGDGQRSLLTKPCMSAPSGTSKPTELSPDDGRLIAAVGAVKNCHTTLFDTIKRLTRYRLLGSIWHVSYLLYVTERLSCCKTGGNVRI